MQREKSERPASSNNQPFIYDSVNRVCLSKQGKILPSLGDLMPQYRLDMKTNVSCEEEDPGGFGSKIDD